ncbi:molybdopterin-dependent oxidoreductase [Halothiobacillus sp. DCM-1]|uniref:molybdopterin-dependent oxidoreductase n=1 Tax=Halothiobacillus sp. DCM-1 TaxID=3112558 RepID=UPI00324F5FA4
MNAPVATTCPYCGVGCGVLVTRGEAGVTVAGDTTHPANLGRLCSKGAALGETVDLPDRLSVPLSRSAEGTLVPTDWDSALDRIATAIRQTVAEHGPEAIGLYVSGQILTEDYYIANKLMKGFLGSANIDTNSRLCMSSAVAAYHRAFGSDTVPVSYEDVEQADLVILVGSNLAYAHPVLFQRLSAAKAERPAMRIIVIDPRATATASIADQHLAIAPGSDALLFNALLVAIDQTGAVNEAFIQQSVDGFEEARASAWAEAADLDRVAERTGLTTAQLTDFFAAFIRTERTVTLWSQGLNQSASGTDKGNALINCHLATGRVGKPGCGPFSITGQPNAMGGREVGGLANMLAAHQGFTPENIDRMRRFWGSDTVATAPGLKAVDLFAAAAEGKIRFLWIIATNPAFSLPDSHRVRAALARCPFVVLSECVGSTDTAAYADLLLPATGWGERDGTVTNSERRISRQRAFLPPHGQSRHDWQVLCDVATRLGFGSAFAFEHASDVFREYAALTAFENAGSRDLDLGGFRQLDRAAYDALPPTRWPIHADGSQPEPFADGRFFTANRRARMIPIRAQSAASALTIAMPLRLNTGRLRDQWHGMSRTGAVAKLFAHEQEPTLRTHPQDAARFKLRGHQLARVRNRQGQLLARVVLDDGQRPGSLFAPMHWSDGFSRDGLVNALIAPRLDPVSGQPEFKTEAVWVEPYPAAWYGLVLLRHDAVCPPFSTAPGDYAARVTRPAGLLLHLAGTEPPAAAISALSDWLRHSNPASPDEEILAFADPASGRYRQAWLRGGALFALCAITPDSRAPDTDWLTELLGQGVLSAGDRGDLLAGKRAGAADRGPVICACFSVGKQTLLDVLAEHPAADVATLGACTQAGTNCGACIPELKALLAAHAVAASVTDAPSAQGA